MINDINEERRARIKGIGIINIAKALGINVKGNKSLCYNGHDKNSASLSFSDSKGVFYCFGCGDGGDGVTLVMKVLNIDFKNACDWLSREFELDDGRYLARKVRPTDKISPKVLKEQQQDDFISNPEIYEWIIENTSLSERAKKYLVKKRGFSFELLEELRIRDVENPSVFFDRITSVWDKQILLKCGVAKQNERGIIKSVWWDHVIIFPFFNLDKRIDYLQARRLDVGEPKYVNLKSVKPSIFNLHSLLTLPRNSRIFICEGIPDAISAIQYKMNSVAILGAHGFKEEWVRYFVNFNIYVIPDNDEAGKKFAEKLRQVFKIVGKPITVIKLPKNIKDLNEFYNRANN